MQADVHHVTPSVRLEMSLNHQTPNTRECRAWVNEACLTWDRLHCCSPGKQLQHRSPANRQRTAFQNHTAKSDPTVNTPQTHWLSSGPSGLRFFFFCLGNGCVKVWRVKFDPIKRAERGFLMFWLQARLGSAGIFLIFSNVSGVRCPKTTHRDSRGCSPDKSMTTVIKYYVI